MFKVNRTHNELIIYQTLAVIRRNGRRHRAKGSLQGGGLPPIALDLDISIDRGTLKWRNIVKRCMEYHDFTPNYVMAKTTNHCEIIPATLVTCTSARVQCLADA